MSTTSSKNPVTIVDVARAASVSHSTVSRVLNGRPYIKAETRKRVMEAAEELGYVANLKARGLAGGRLGVVGFVVESIDGSYQAEMVRGVDRALAEVGLDLMLCTTHAREQREASYVSRLSVGLVDGLIVLLPESADRYSHDLSSRHFPFVLLDHMGSSQANSVVATNVQGAIDALEHLAELGHRRVAHITGDQRLVAGRERLDGFKRGVQKFSLDADPSLIVEGDFHAEGGRQAALRLLELDEPPTAIFIASDDMAIAAIEVMVERGLSVPGDMSVVGFDDIPEADLVRPRLTTVRQPLHEMGRRAVALLLDQIERPENPVAHLNVPTEFVVRESTGPFPQG